MRGIRNCLERNTVTMIDYLACVSSLPDQFSPAANSSSFLSGPDKHERLHVINSLRERLTGPGNTIPTLYKDAIPLLPYALDVPKHLAILSSAVVRNARTGASPGLYGTRGGSAGVGATPATATTDDAGGWSLKRFSDLCFDVEAQALKSVAMLAQGAANAGGFGGPRTKRSGSVSSTGRSQHGRPGSSRGTTPTGPPAGGSTPAVTTTPTQTSPAPWNNQARRPASSRSVITPTGPHGSNASPGPSPGGNSNASHSPGAPYSQASGSPAKEVSTAGTAQVITLQPPKQRKSNTRPSTAPNATSSSHLGDPFVRERKASNTSQGYAPDASPAAASFRYLPPEQSYPQETRRPEDVGLPATPISPGQSSNGSGGRHPAYPTIHRGESDSVIPFHYPSRYQGSSERLRAATVSTKSERRSSSARFMDFMKRPSTTSGSPSLSAPTSAPAQRPPWTWGGSANTGGGYRSGSGDDVIDPASPSHSRATKMASSGADDSDPRRKRTDTGAKKKGLFSWLGKK
jgi:hypothetical protein